MEAPNRMFLGDITHLESAGGWLYLAVLIDLHSRKVVGRALDETMKSSACLRTLERAMAPRGDLTRAFHHSDWGCQYASHTYRKTLEEAGMQVSVSRKGNCWDNAVAESFFGTLKHELRPDKPWRDFAEARQAVSDSIHRYYNLKRRHSTLGYVSPVEF